MIGFAEDGADRGNLRHAVQLQELRAVSLEQLPSLVGRHRRGSIADRPGCLQCARWYVGLQKSVELCGHEKGVTGACLRHLLCILLWFKGAAIREPDSATHRHTRRNG